MKSPLPPGQRAGDSFPRFGAVFGPPLLAIPGVSALRLSGQVRQGASREVTPVDLEALPRCTQTSDLHCVTTWSKTGLEWSGWPLREVWERLLAPRAEPRGDVGYLVFYGRDGYRATLALQDALVDDVLLADRLDGEPLSPLHGAPLRLVSPRQYGYKSVKHVTGIGLRREPPVGGLRFGLENLRGRVAQQERHAFLPAWLVRLPYRALIAPAAYLQSRGSTSTAMVGTPTLLDEVMPRYDVHELHHTYLDASPSQIWHALAAVTGHELRLLGPLMALRELPARLVGRTIGGFRRRPLFEGLLQAGFVRLAEQASREIVFGVVGRFWNLTANAPRRLDGRDAFEAFAEPGYARAAMNFVVRREGRGSRLITETRVDTTDESARRRFRRYWWFIRPGSGTIRRSWLAAVRRRLASGAVAGGNRSSGIQIE